MIQNTWLDFTDAKAIVSPDDCVKGLYDGEKIFQFKSSIRDDEEFRYHVEQYKERLADLKHVEKMLDEARHNLIKLAGEKTCHGYGISIEKVSRRGYVDYTAIPELKNVDLDEYRKPAVEYWKITM